MSTQENSSSDDIDRSLGTTFRKLIDISNNITDGVYTFTDKKFLNDIDDVSTEFKFSDLLLNPEQVPEGLEGTGFGSKDSYGPVVQNVDHIQFCGFASLMFYHMKKYNPKAATELYEKHHEVLDSDEYRIYLNLFKSYVIQNNQHNPDFDNLGTAVELAEDSIQNCPEHYLIFLNAAESLVKLLEVENRSKIEIEHDERVDKAKEFAESATRLNQDYSRGHVVEARAKALANNYESALKSLDSAYEIERDSRKPSIMSISELDQISRELRLNNQAYELTSRIKEANDSIQDTEDEVKRLDEDLDESLDRFRSNSLQFIGFFAAVITLAVTSADVVVSSGRTLQQDAGLITILTGGLLVGFGAFGLLLPKSREDIEKKDRRIAVVICIGGVLMLIGILSAYL